MKNGLLSSIAFASTMFLGAVLPLDAAQSLKMSGVVHIENYGDQPFADSRWNGTKGQSLRLEGYAIAFTPPIAGLGLQYMCHLEDLGDQPWVTDGTFCGTRGQSRRLEGLAIKLTGPEAPKYDIYYACHLEDIGDTNFVLDGGFCGTRGQSRRLEALTMGIDLAMVGFLLVRFWSQMPTIAILEIGFAVAAMLVLWNRAHVNCRRLHEVYSQAKSSPSFALSPLDTALRNAAAITLACLSFSFFIAAWLLLALTSVVRGH